MRQPYDYSLYNKFIEKFISQGFQNIDRQDPLVVELELLLDQHNQFFYVGDLMQIKIHFSSKGSLDYIGVPPEELDPSVFFKAVHPEDRVRHSLATAKLFKTAHELFYLEHGKAMLSANVRVMKSSGQYANTLFTTYSFYSNLPVKTVYLLAILTDISHVKFNKHSYHYYHGEDISLFRYPDEELLKVGSIFSDREFEIIKLISQGMDSSLIAKELFLSINTVNTHRRNILKKTNKTNTYELILELKESGML